MNKEQALQSFWSSFGLPAYDENTVPDTAQMPYITYSTETDSFENVVNLTASIWYRSTSWAAITQKKNAIAENVGVGGKVIKIDDGYVWLTRGTPFASRMSDPNDDAVRRIYINLEAEFLTAN